MMLAQARKFVLILEDELLIAMELATLVENMGFAVLGPAGSCQEALTLLQSQKPDAAIIDILVRDETCEHVVDDLDRLGVPWAVCTGFRPSSLDPRYRTAQVIQKPLSSANVEHLLSALIDQVSETSQHDVSL